MYQNFEGIYGNLINQIGELAQEKEEFKIKAKQLVKAMIIVLAVFVLIGLLYFIGIINSEEMLRVIVLAVGVISIAILLKLLLKTVDASEQYNQIFKTEVLPKMILNIDKNLDYKPKQGLTENQYKNSGLAIDFNKFSSEDYISGYFADNALLEMSEINAEYITVNKDGVPTTTASFNGILVVATLKKSVNNNIKIVKNSIWKTDRNANIRIASIEFEKHFDVYADNKVQALQIFTSDIIEVLLSFTQELKINVQIAIKDDKFYMTFETGEMYEGGISQNTKDLLSRYYIITTFIVDLVKSINKSIEEIVL